MFDETKKVYKQTFDVDLVMDEFLLNTSSSALWNQKCTPSYDIVSQLSAFKLDISFRQSNAIIWQLITGCKTSDRNGIGYNNFKDNRGYSVIYLEDKSILMMHEIAHNFGVTHDSKYGSCPCTECEKYIMSRNIKYSIPEFSICSKKEFQKGLEGIISQKRILRTLCGNGVLDKEEECDSGIEYCTKDCKFKPGIECSDYESNGCCKNGKILPKGFICENSSTCTFTSVCNGKSPMCPVRMNQKDGTSCKKGYCANGICTNRDLYVLKTFGFKSCDKKSCKISVFKNKCRKTDKIYWNGIKCGFGAGNCFNGDCTFNQEFKK